MAGIFNSSIFNNAIFNTGESPPPVVVQPSGGGTSKRKRRVIRFSDLDERERLEALAAIPVKPFTPLEQAAVNIGEADEEEQADDELILMALMKIYH